MQRTRTSRQGIVLLQTAVGDYRQQVLEELVALTGGAFKVYCGPEYFDGTTKTRVHIGDHRQEIKNHFLLNRRFLWQTGMWRSVFTANTTILEFNPRIISNLPILLIRKALNKRTVLWGHAWPRSGPQSRTTPLRKLLASLCDAIIVYTETQADELRAYLPSTRIVPAPNALYRVSQMGGLPAANPTDFIYVGRLVKEKKPQLLLSAFLQALPGLPSSSCLVFVGDGPMRPELEQSAEASGDRVRFVGHVSEPEQLRQLYARSLASVSPGYVGLAITQSFSFGVPMVIAREEQHAPEIEAAQEGVNSLFFEKDNAGDLASALLEVVKDRPQWIAKRWAITADCASRYSVDLMAQRILQACEFPSRTELLREAA